MPSPAHVRRSKMSSSTHIRLASLASPFAPALAVAALALASLPGCSGGSGGSAGTTSTAAAAAGAPSETGYDGALLPGNLRPRGFTLTDQDGRRVSLSDFKGKVTILAFVYTTSKTTAPLIAQQIRGALEELPAGTPAVAISLDPAGDTPARVRAFLHAASLKGRMEYLTGSAAQLRPVWRAYAAVPASAGAVAYERGAFVLLLDREGAPRVEFPVEELTPEALAHDVRKLERE
ncbi:MAG TPA: SCO family protein [Solirubrobacteraceae bacterium]|jgi:protein SCO1/2|nr:SCO family protein [Solirubrobacteraceae bacterium]